MAAARGRTYRHCVWLNPLPEEHWGYTPSIAMIRDLMEGRMYPLTLEGLDAAMVGADALTGRAPEEPRLSRPP